MENCHADSAETNRLLELVKAGDPSAFGRLFDRHCDSLLVFLTNHFDPRLTSASADTFRIAIVRNDGNKPGGGW